MTSSLGFLLSTARTVPEKRFLLYHGLRTVPEKRFLLYHGLRSPLLKMVPKCPSTSISEPLIKKFSKQTCFCSEKQSNGIVQPTNEVPPKIQKFYLSPILRGIVFFTYLSIVAAASLILDFCIKPEKFRLTLGLISALLVVIMQNNIAKIMYGLLFCSQFHVGDIINLKIKDVQLTGTIERIGLISPICIRDLTGKSYFIDNVQFAESIPTLLSDGMEKLISFQFLVPREMAQKVHHIVTRVEKILEKFSNHSQNICYAEVFQEITISVLCFVRANNVNDYARIQRAIVLEVIKLLANGES